MTKPTQADIGRALGISPANMTKLKKQGMPVDSIKAARAWRNKHQSVARVTGQGKSLDAAAVRSEAIQAPPQAANGEPVPDFNLSRARSEAAEARLSQLSLNEALGVLIRRDEVEAILARQCAAVRDGLLQLPARLAPALAHQSNVRRVESLLDRELRQILAQMVGLSA